MDYESLSRQTAGLNSASPNSCLNCYMRKLVPFILALFTLGHVYAQSAAELNKSRVTLPNGWSLSPAGKSLKLGDLPLNMAISSSGKWMAVTNNGQSTQELQLIDLKTEKTLSRVVIPKSWLGLKFSRDEKFLYASGGNDNWILKYAVQASKLVLKDSIKLGAKWPVRISPAGIDIDDQRQLLYVVTKEDNTLYIVDLRLRVVVKKIELGAEAYTCLLSPNRSELYISCWGCDKLIIINTSTQSISESIAVGDNPNDICISKNGKYLFVANANDNSVSVIDIQKRKLLETLNAALYPDAPSGSTSNSVCLSPDDRQLYIANADNNCLAVFDVSKPGFSHSLGYIPVGWYPTCVKTLGKKIYAANGKGFSSRANPNGPNPTDRHEEVRYGGDHSKPIVVEYIGGLFKGTLSIINQPSEKQMAIYSQAVYNNTPYKKEKELNLNEVTGNPIPHRVGDKSPIKYVFYILKENRTYDQVLGDMKEGNGDSSLCLFPEKITPNQHALSKAFVLLDNFYVDGEVSADGHNWSMGAYATDYLEKTWVTSYGGRGGSYDGEGNRAIANNKMGFIWDHCKRAGVSYRTYGEFADDYKPNLPVLQGNFCPYYTGWNQKVRDTTRVNQWAREFDSLLAANSLPQLSTLRLPNDHTEGLNRGRPTPFAHAADNDWAVGMFVEHLSKSPIWNESVVFIVEDDAQNGPDHVDAHRTTAYVAGGMVKRNFVDHSMYSTSSMLRTIELILGIPPMSQYDAAANPMWNCFTDKVDGRPFLSIPAQIDITTKNLAYNEDVKRSEAFDFSKEDRVPDLSFNEILWKGIMGVSAPAPKRAAFVRVMKGDEDE